MARFHFNIFTLSAYKNCFLQGLPLKQYQYNLFLIAIYLNFLIADLFEKQTKMFLLHF